MRQPVLFLAFANDQDDHLPLLDEERKAISNHLVPLESQQYIQLFTESSATIKDISDYLVQFKDRVAIFHYAGHADSKKIMLAGQAANSDGLADLLGLQSNLQLVFLNGCSTKEQVKLLLEKGVPAVIATSVAISDEAAREFSDIFYKALSTDHTIEQAFEMAAARHKMAKGETVAVHRGIKMPEEKDDLPWGLYVHPDKTEILRWKIPLQQASSFIIQDPSIRYTSGEPLNKKLVETIANAIADYSFTINILVETAKRRKREPKLRELRVAVIDSFPIPIGIHLRKLIQSEEINRDRLQKIINVYAVSTELLAFVMLAQLWDERFRNEKMEIPAEQMKLIKDFLEMGQDEQQDFNYIELIRGISDVFDVNKIEPFVEEFDQLRQEFLHDGDFQQAYFSLEEFKKLLKGTIDSEDIESYCVQAEEHLCTIFKHVGFAAKYTLATIKTIELHKQRHRDPSFYHNLVILNRLMESVGVLDDVLKSDSFSDNNSVILLRDEEDIIPFLNLSPFIIDENALARQNNSKLFFYRNYKDGKLSYLLAENRKDELTVGEGADEYSEVLDQFLEFKALMTK